MLNDLSEIKCANCKHNDDIMLMEQCYGCSLIRSKPNETIKFEKNEEIF